MDLIAVCLNGIHSSGMSEDWGNFLGASFLNAPSLVPTSPATRPSGQTAPLSNRAGGSADNLIATGLDISAATTTTTTSPSGQWRLFVRDFAAIDVGTINSFVLHITTNN